MTDRVRTSISKVSVALGLEPTESITPVLEYIQALREVPQQTGFPSDVVWPTLPPEAPQ